MDVARAILVPAKVLEADSLTLSTPTPEERRMRSPYNYVPTEWICALFVALFALSTLIHVAQAVKFRLWWMFPTAVAAGIAEILGWSGRLWSSQNPTALTPFLMQISTTILAPTPLVAANFIILGQLIRRLGTQYSRLSPNLYTIIFCSADAISLIVQAVGGGIASTEAQTGQNAAPGGHIMLGGIVFQMICITIYVALASEFLFRYLTQRPIPGRVLPHAGSESDGAGTHTPPEPLVEKPGDRAMRDPPARGALTPRTRLMLQALCFSTVCIFIRSVYRTVELSDGWTGRIIATERYFDWLDGGMITLAMYTLNIFHPGYLLREPTK